MMGNSNFCNTNNILTMCLFIVIMSRHDKIAKWTKSAQFSNFERNIEYKIKILCHSDFIFLKNKRKIAFSLKYTLIL